MRSGIVKLAGKPVGRIQETDQGFRFQYDTDYLGQPDASPVSLTLPLRPEAFESPHLFSFFEGLLSEGSLRAMQSRKHQIDEEDSFGLLLNTTSADVIGNVTVEPEEVES